MRPDSLAISVKYESCSLQRVALESDPYRIFPTIRYKYHSLRIIARTYAIIDKRNAAQEYPRLLSENRLPSEAFL